MVLFLITTTLFVQIKGLTSTSKTSAISVNCGRDG